MSNGSLRSGILALAVVSVGLGFIVSGQAGEKPSKIARAVNVGEAPFAKGATISDVAEGSVQGVVNISTTRLVKSGRLGATPLNDPFFDYFFGPRSGRRLPRERRTTSLGSGVIISDDGIVLTNNHVVEGATDIAVTLFDEREVAAELVGADPKSDLAVLRLKGDITDLHPIPLGDSHKLRLGETVLAIGNPFGLGHTVTSGIVSAMGRANMGIIDYEDFIQTDAAINPGNSGGALLNARGQLVGINTAIVSRTGGYQGIGFAIPSSMVIGIANSIIGDGKVTRGWLGVAIQDIDGALAKALALRTEKGVLVADAAKGGPAEKAGLQRGDVILEIDGEATRSTGRLRNIIAGKGEGAKVEVSLLREGRKEVIVVELTAQPENYSMAAEVDGSTTAYGGLTVADLTGNEATRHGLPKGFTAGVLVTAVTPGSAAYLVGFKAGDVILEVDRVAVTGAEGFRKAYLASGKTVLLLALRDRHTQYVVMPK
jgi:serine protease Do